MWFSIAQSTLCIIVSTCTCITCYVILCMMTTRLNLIYPTRMVSSAFVYSSQYFFVARTVAVTVECRVKSEDPSFNRNWRENIA